MNRSYQQLFQHFPKEEKAFIEQIIDFCQQADRTYSYRLTPFLNPKQDEIAKSIAAHFQLRYWSSRNLIATEYSRGIIAPDYYMLDEDDFEMSMLEVLYPRKYATLTHSQILGTLINRLGVKRQYIGDILLEKDHTYVLLDKRFVPLLMSEVEQISRMPVSFEECAVKSVVVDVLSDASLEKILISSLRLDKLVAAVFRLARSRASQLIEAKQVKVDYLPITQVGKSLEVGQLVSVRGFGRVRIKEIVGYSKNGKAKVEIEVIRK
ncbi:MULTISPECIES: RNA-binding protein [unclassified Streptococcus]|uniref:YlmH family RNA-binding protein n=1 Tax=unclassified Streptococcus TaxID=2608887 RepID=UPI00107284C1|nr:MULTISPECIES: YlmH/Sll1252 family protein [unclassified Streptococcus]MBF0786828.1 RNA-binding protein [Streptococcus sp. 19428wC2_LYSM12]MCQ9211068.1 YlmH/Sll1252 family protein [Streptococcus sp. B01]MCQ9214343.1 YlmH/Sll1252 family protein [Streptococcus sp. O1]TFV06371.1 RNA-binding protein [Streptococcus sp. LYSM12]